MFVKIKKMSCFVQRTGMHKVGVYRSYFIQYFYQFSRKELNIPTSIYSPQSTATQEGFRQILINDLSSKGRVQAGISGHPRQRSPGVVAAKCCMSFILKLIRSNQ